MLIYFLSPTTWFKATLAATNLPQYAAGTANTTSRATAAMTFVGVHLSVFKFLVLRILMKIHTLPSVSYSGLMVCCMPLLLLTHHTHTRHNGEFCDFATMQHFVAACVWQPMSWTHACANVVVDFTLILVAIVVDALCFCVSVCWW